PALGYTLHGFVGTDTDANSSITGTGTCARALGETVPGSPYAITCTPGTGPGALSAPNYGFAAGAPADFTITKAPSTTTITCPTTPQTYTGSAIEPCTAQLTGVNPPPSAVTVTYTDNVNVGTAHAAASWPVDANPNTKVYGADDPALGYTLHGFVGTDTDANSSITGTGTCARALGETVPGSPYAIACTPGTGPGALSAPNYGFAAGAPADF